MERLRFALAAAACLGATAIGLSACGSGGGGSDFAAEANEVCTDAARAHLAVYESPVGEERSRSDALAANSRYLAAEEEAVDALGQIEPPADGAEDFEAFVAAEREVVELRRKALKAAREDERDAFGKLSEERSEKADEAEAKAAAVAGLDACASQLSSAEAKTVAGTIEEKETEADPAQCTEYFTPHVVKLGWKTLAGCRKFQEGESADEITKSVDVDVTEGVDGVTATADVTFHGGNSDGEELEYGLAYHDGRWMLAYVAPKEG
jgi:hypothetical protein